MKKTVFFFLSSLLCVFPLSAQQQQPQQQPQQPPQQQQPPPQQQQPPPQQQQEVPEENTTPDYEGTIPVAIPAMRNVFFNTLWGSVAGGLVASSFHMLDDSKNSIDRFSSSDISITFFNGATIGGLIGVSIGLLLSFNNVSFYEEDFLMETDAVAQNINHSQPNLLREDIEYFNDGSVDMAIRAPSYEQEIQFIKFRF